MAEAELRTLKQTLQQVQADLQALQARGTESIVEQPASTYPALTDPNQINYEMYKSLPVFDGTTKGYRSWRNTVSYAMKLIEHFNGTRQYHDALFTVRYNKIRGEADDLLQNHGTPLNFQAIINRLDYNYADKRSYNTLIEEMKRQYQGRQTLSEFHSKICQVFNAAMTKCEIDYPGNFGPLQEVTKDIAVDCFRNGLNDEFTQTTLYGSKPRDLESAYAIASEIEYKRMNNPLRRNTTQRSYVRQDNTRYQPVVQPRENNIKYTSTPMEVDNSYRNVRPQQQTNQWQPQNQNPFRNNYDRQLAGFPPSNTNRGEPFKREHQPNSMRSNTMPQKQQRINQILDDDPAESTKVNIDEEEFENRATFLEE